MDSYRPISIIPVFAKVLESVIAGQLTRYLEEHDLLSDQQHGFRRGRSTVTALMNLTARIKSAFEEKEFASLALCDLSKAFDCISHQILLGKLERYGIGGTALTTFKSYFTNRQQVFAVHGAKSCPSIVHHGVPQGSVLGPILFLVAVNDLRIDNKTLLFADDTTIFAVGRPLVGVLSETDDLLNRAKMWFTSNKLKLNESKTQKMICSLNHVDSDQSDSVKLLGFTLDPKLSWNKHVEATCKKLTRVVYLLRRLVHLVSQTYLVVAYYSLFHSHLSYGLLLWGHSTGCSDILLLQKRAVRVITRSGRLDHCRPLFQQLGILTVHSQFILDCVCYVKDHFSNFETRGQHHLHQTRQRDNIDNPFTRLSLTRDSFPNVAVRLYNALPANVRHMDGSRFKVTMKDWLKTKPLYSLSEYYDDDFSSLSMSTANVQ